MNDFYRITPLPEQVTQIAVRSDFLSYRLAQLQKRFRVVHDEIGMHLESQPLDAMLARKLRRLFPVGNDLLFPLPIEHLLELRRPAIGHPVRHRIGWRSTRTPREAHDDGHFHPLRQ